MIISTTPSVEGRSITKQLSIVSGEALAVGGLTENMEKKFLAELKVAHIAAINGAIAKAEALGADTIVGFRIEHTPISTGAHTALLVMATGTAVKLA